MAEKRATILVVDDSEEVREYYQLTLEGAGYDVQTASNGEEAFQIVRQQREDKPFKGGIRPDPVLSGSSR
jgi:CheY-like chemotaxis protein